MSTETTTPAELARLAAEAPRGPWRFDPDASLALQGRDGLVLATVHSVEAGAFIAAAREAVPALLREREALVSLVRQHIVQFGVCLACGPVKDGHALRCPALPFLAD